MKIKVRGKNTNTAMPEYQVPFEIFTIVAPEPVTENLTLAGTVTATNIVATEGFGIFGETVTVQEEVATAALTTVTHTAPATPDYAVQITGTTPYGFATSDEGLTVLSVIANLQTRVNELEAALQAYGILS
jgi:hypothetical protein